MRKNGSTARWARRHSGSGSTSGISVHGESNDLRDPQLTVKDDAGTQRIAVVRELPVACWCERTVSKRPQALVRAGEAGFSCGRPSCRPAPAPSPTEGAAK